MERSGPNYIEGDLTAAGRRFGIVAARFNDFIVRPLLDGALDDAVVCLGAVIRGATAHFDYVAGGAASGISTVAMEADLPVIFGVITTETIEQAIERAGSKAGNKGFEAAATAIEMVSLLDRVAELATVTEGDSQSMQSDVLSTTIASEPRQESAPKPFDH